MARFRKRTARVVRGGGIGGATDSWCMLLLSSLRSGRCGGGGSGGAVADEQAPPLLADAIVSRPATTK